MPNVIEPEFLSTYQILSVFLVPFITDIFSPAVEAAIAERDKTQFTEELPRVDT